MFSSFVIAQISQDYNPLSVNHDGNFERRTIVLPMVDVEQLIDEDERMSHLKRMRFGYEHELDQNFLEEANVPSNNDGKIF